MHSGWYSVVHLNEMALANSLHFTPLSSCCYSHYHILIGRAEKVTGVSRGPIIVLMFREKEAILLEKSALIKNCIKKMRTQFFKVHFMSNMVL